MILPLKNLSRAVALMALMTLGLHLSLAQWKHGAGPVRGWIDAFVAVPVDTPSARILLFAGGNRGVYISTDTGSTWTESRTGLAEQEIWSLAVSPAAGQKTVFAGTNSGGVFSSADYGKNWTGTGAGLPVGSAHYRVTGFAVSRSPGAATLFTGVTAGGVYRTTDEGSTWAPVNEGMKNALFSQTPTEGVLSIGKRSPVITSLAVSGDYLFAGSYGDGVFVSTNNGHTWSQVGNGLPMRDVSTNVSALVAVGSKIFAAVGSHGVYLTSDDGRYWGAVRIGLPKDNVFSLAVCSPEGGKSGTILFAGLEREGVYFSTNDGKRWDPLNSGLLIRNVYSVFVIGKTLLAGTSAGVWKRTIPEISATAR